MFKHLSIGTKHFNKGDVILRQGDSVEYLYLLESGTCYRHMVTDKGDTIIYAIKKPGNTVSSLLGVLNLYNRDETSCFSFVARSACQCQCIPVESFREWVENQPAILKELIILASDNPLELRHAFRSFQEGRIANRLCRILMNCSEKTKDGLIITKDYTFAEMASMLGVHHVTVSRIVRSLCNDGVLQKQHQFLKILDFIINFFNILIHNFLLFFLIFLILKDDFDFVRLIIYDDFFYEYPDNLAGDCV